MPFQESGAAAVATPFGLNPIRQGAAQFISLAPMIVGANGTPTPPEAELRMSMFAVAEDFPLDQLGIEITTAGTAGVAVCRIGLWNHDDVTGRPSGLLAEGTVPGDAVALPSIAVALTLQPGFYWAGCVTQGGAAARPALRCVEFAPGPFPLMALAASSSRNVCALQDNGIAGALPNTPQADNMVSTAPWMWGRVP